MKKFVLAAIVIALVGCHTARAGEPLFQEDDEFSEDGDFEESISLPKDSIGRVSDINGIQWTKGADDHYRSDDDDCVFSKPLNKFVCTKN